MSYFECNRTKSTLFTLNTDCFSFEIGYCFSWMKTRNVGHSWVDPHAIDSHFSVFPSDIWCKLHKLLIIKSKRNIDSPNVALNEDSKVSSKFVKKMWPIEYRIVRNITIFVIALWLGRWLHHHNSRSFHLWSVLNQTVSNSDLIFFKLIAIASS